MGVTLDQHISGGTTFNSVLKKVAGKVPMQTLTVPQPKIAQ